MKFIAVAKKLIRQNIYGFTEYLLILPPPPRSSTDNILNFHNYFPVKEFGFNIQAFSAPTLTFLPATNPPFLTFCRVKLTKQYKPPTIWQL